MSVIIIGCGGSGSAIASQLSGYGIDRIKLADYSLATAENLMEKLQKTKSGIEFEAITLNAEKTTEVKKALAGTDVVINSASPLCNISIMKACIISGTNYIDLASDPFSYPGVAPNTTLDSQMMLNGAFEKKGLIAVTNAGASPGFSDILCKHAAKKYGMEAIKHVKIYFAEVIESDRLIVGWSPYIFLLESLFPATVYQNKNISEIAFQKRQKKIKFPQPVGKMNVTLLNGHPELRTIPEFMNIPVEYVEIGGGVLLNSSESYDIIMEALSRRIKESVILNGDILKNMSMEFEHPDKLVEYYNEGFVKKELLSCSIDILGVKQNKKVQYNASVTLDIKKVTKTSPLASATSYMVSVAPSIIAKKIIEGDIAEKGVIAPAALDSASDIVEESKNMGLNLKEKVS